MTPDLQKIVQAGIAVAIVVISGAFVLMPLFSTFERAVQKNARLQDRLATIRLLEARLQAEREALADAVAPNREITTILNSALEETTRRPPLQAICSKISNRLSKNEIAPSVPCTEERRPLDDRFGYQTVEFSVTGPLAQILSVFDESVPGTQAIERLEISGPDYREPSQHGTVRIRLASIIPKTGNIQK